MALPEHLAPKVHPATRAVEPEDPMNLHGSEVPGDPELMLRLLVEEYARMGRGLEELLAMFRSPFYQAPHALYSLYGEEELRRRIAEVLARVGVTRVRSFTREPAGEPDELVELKLPATAEGSGQNA